MVLLNKYFSLKKKMGRLSLNNYMKYTLPFDSPILHIYMTFFLENFVALITTFISQFEMKITEVTEIALNKLLK